MSEINQDFFKNNRQRLKSNLKHDMPVIITANGLIQKGGDNTYTFSQDANFWYLSGIDLPDIVLVIDSSEEYIIVPNRSSTRQTFDGRIPIREILNISGIRSVYNETDGWHKLAKRVKQVSKIATLASPEQFIKGPDFYVNPARHNLINKLRSINADFKLMDIRSQLALMRMIKQPGEIIAIKKAIDLTIKAFNEVTSAKQLKNYNYEYQVEADISRSFRFNGASGHAFSPIVANGHRACVLHNIENNGHINANQLLLIDIGAEVNHYAADLTRTYSVNSFSNRQKAVYQAVLEVQSFALSLLKPGIFLKEYEKKVALFMAEQLKGLGLINSDKVDDVRRYYPHSTSHFLGLNVHDVGDYSRPLAPGTVLTVEPGIYIPAESIGVRLEDDIVINEKSHQILSADLAKTL